jgi:hypothetical protein
MQQLSTMMSSYLMSGYSLATVAQQSRNRPSDSFDSWHHDVLEARIEVFGVLANDD